MAGRALIVEILGNATQFGRELDKAAGKTRQFSRAAGVAGLAIAGGLAYGLEKSVKAAMAAETSTARLNQAFKQSGESASRYGGLIDKAEASSRNLGFSNIDVRESLGSLEIATKDHTKAIQDLSVAEDIARFKHVDLAAASKMLTMAMAGSQRAVKQLGITVPALTTHYDALKRTGEDLTTVQGRLDAAHAKLQDKMATSQAVIAAVTQKVHGQAQAFSETAAGGMARFHAQSEQIQESLGKVLLPAVVAVTGALADFTGVLARHAGVVKVAVVALGLLAAALLASSIYIRANTEGTALNLVVTKAAAAANKVFALSLWLVNAALLANPIVLIVVGLAALGAALYLAWTKSETFRHVVKAVWADVKTAVMGVVNFFTTSVPQAFQSILNWVRNNWPKIAVLLAGPFAPLVALATNAFGVRSALIGALQHVITWLSSAWTFVKGLIIAPFKVGDKIASIIGDFPGMMRDSFVHAWHAFEKKVKHLFRDLLHWIAGEAADIGSGIGHKIIGAAEDMIPGSGLIPGIPHGDAPVGVAGAGTLGTLLAFAHAEGFNPTVAQTYGGHHAPGSYHYQRRAVDMSGSAGHMRRGFLDAISTFGVGRIKELFYDPMGYFIKNGTRISGAIGGHMDHVHLALGQGGIVTSPTLALIGESGPEAVIPLRRGGGMGGNVTVNVNGWVGNDQALARKIRDELVGIGRVEPNIFGGFS